MMFAPSVSRVLVGSDVKKIDGHWWWAEVSFSIVADPSRMRRSHFVKFEHVGSCPAGNNFFMSYPGAFRLSNWFSTRVITDPQDLQSVYRLRFRVYCEERGFMPPEDYPDGLERDAWDRHSVNFAAFDRDGRVAAAVRLVCPRPDMGLPYEQHCPLYDDALLPSPASTAEVSRLVLNRGYRTPPGGGSTGTVVMEVYRAMYQYSRQHGVRYWFAAMERSLVRRLARFGVMFERIGPDAEYCGPVAPYLLDLEALDFRLAQSNPGFLHYLSSSQL